VHLIFLLVNGGYPGPLIFANKGDTLKIKVQNKLKDPSMYQTTSIVRLSPFLRILPVAESITYSTGTVFSNVGMLTMTVLRSSLK
jgi:FtsP/CotA-like multicopper oxidase with cupredoxin domain